MKTKSMIYLVLALSFASTKAVHAETYVSDCLTLNTIHQGDDERRALDRVTLSLVQTKTCILAKKIRSC